MCEKKIEKIADYKVLKDDIARLWKMWKVTVIPIVFGGLGAISNQFEKFTKEVGMHIRVENVQKTALLVTAGILRCVLGSWFPGFLVS